MSLRQQKFSFLSHRLISLVKALYQNLFPECTKMRIFRCNFATVSRGHAPGPPRMVVPSALPLNWFVTSHDCDETLPPFGNILRTPLHVPVLLSDVITPVWPKVPRSKLRNRNNQFCGCIWYENDLRNVPLFSQKLCLWKVGLKKTLHLWLILPLIHLIPKNACWANTPQWYILQLTEVCSGSNTSFMVNVRVSFSYW